MFNSARLKLTGWYLLIIMVISISFSAVLYRLLTLELNQLIDRQNARLEKQYGAPNYRSTPLLDRAIVDEVKTRLAFNFMLINGLIFIGAGGLGFILAGKTLRPIKKMVDEQNRFIADASHELRTPITALKTTLEVSLRDESLSLKEAKATLRENLEDVNRLQFLASALLELTYCPRESTSVREIAQVADATKEALRVVKPLAAAKKIRIESEVAPITAVISTKELTDVLIILLDNAIKYSADKTAINLIALERDHQAFISVTDQGIGIPAVDLPHIFDRFYRADSSRSEATGSGYGLGLAIAKETIQRNQGALSVTSKPNVGTTFSMKLKMK